MTKGEGGQKSQKYDDVFYERPLTLREGAWSAPQTGDIWSFQEKEVFEQIKQKCYKISKPMLKIRSFRPKIIEVILILGLKECQNSTKEIPGAL